MNPDSFKQTLRAAASQGDGEFSDVLHTRVMAGVRQARARSAGTPDRRRRVPWLPLTTVAAGLLVLTFGVWTMTHSPKPAAPSSTPGLAAVDLSSIRQAVHNTAGPVRDRLHDARYAYLDRDGKRLADFLVRSLPKLPVIPQQPSQPNGDGPQ
jgi:hypothetical protein